MSNPPNSQATMIHDRSAGALARAIREGETTARAALEHFIARHDTLNAPLNAVVVRDFERAREAADRNIEQPAGFFFLACSLRSVS